MRNNEKKNLRVSIDVYNEARPSKSINSLRTEKVNGF